MISKIIALVFLAITIAVCAAGDDIWKPKPVIIPNWNPNAKTKPWQYIGGRRPRSVEELREEEFDSFRTVESFDSVERFRRSPKSVESLNDLDSRSMERVKRSPKSVESIY
ncbi:unnamed protein product [Leptosia nina]|uniref:Uncharacterized protein n=1 Tax=Leptosia nina TaxID=320188 RepID=A0AAV1J7H5_9NEOP